MKVMKLFPAVLLTVVPAIAAAQPEAVDTVSWGRPESAVPDRTFAIALGTGYAQGGGKLGGELGNLEDVAGPGAAVEVDLGYRIIPQLSLGVNDIALGAGNLPPPDPTTGATATRGPTGLLQTSNLGIGVTELF